MTEKEKLYEWVYAKAGDERRGYEFPDVEEEKESYFEDVCRQPQLEEYDIRDLASIKENMDIVFDEILSEVKMDCIIALLKGYNGLRQEPEEQKTAAEPVKGVPEFIYNF